MRIWYCSLGPSSNWQLTKDWCVHEYKEDWSVQLTLILLILGVAGSQRRVEARQGYDASSDTQNMRIENIKSKICIWHLWLRRGFHQVEAIFLPRKSTWRTLYCWSCQLWCWQGSPWSPVPFRSRSLFPCWKDLNTFHLKLSAVIVLEYPMDANMTLTTLTLFLDCNQVIGNELTGSKMINPSDSLLLRRKSPLLSSSITGGW